MIGLPSSTAAAKLPMAVQRVGGNDAAKRVGSRTDRHMPRYRSRAIGFALGPLFPQQRRESRHFGTAASGHKRK